MTRIQKANELFPAIELCELTTCQTHRESDQLAKLSDRHVEAGVEACPIDADWVDLAESSDCDSVQDRLFWGLFPGQNPRNTKNVASLPDNPNLIRDANRLVEKLQKEKARSRACCSMVAKVKARRYRTRQTALFSVTGHWYFMQELIALAQEDMDDDQQKERLECIRKRVALLQSLAETDHHSNPPHQGK
ncbi:hypothetical protein [Roseiconus lacunae]|uniref:hypothetical protein n=1 Tax=Roseiconus lacunae TaxID=2605694 RepID=UPI001E400DAC|nr:hypothetical protein [Roseiconus lacunae]MCD0457886.1 hypothetical protein [Roseiconus lacunae]